MTEDKKSQSKEEIKQKLRVWLKGKHSKSNREWVLEIQEKEAIEHFLETTR